MYIHTYLCTQVCTSGWFFGPSSFQCEALTRTYIQICTCVIRSKAKCSYTHKQIYAHTTHTYHVIFSVLPTWIRKVTTYTHVYTYMHVYIQSKAIHKQIYTHTTHTHTHHVIFSVPRTWIRTGLLVWVWLGLYVCIYVCIYVRMYDPKRPSCLGLVGHVCMYVCVCVCVCVYIYIYIYIYISMYL